jgi:hypothetical protein
MERNRGAGLPARCPRNFPSMESPTLWQLPSGLREPNHPRLAVHSIVFLGLIALLSLRLQFLR